MLLFLMRHGEAAHPPRGGRDHERELTDRGISDVHAVARLLAHMPFAPEHLYCSPYLRTRQTAEIVGQAMDLEPEPEGLLQVGASVDDLRELIARRPELDRVCCIGHQPTVGRVVYTLTECRVAVSPGTLMLIEAPDHRLRRGQLVGLIPPAMIRGRG